MKDPVSPPSPPFFSLLGALLVDELHNSNLMHILCFTFHWNIGKIQVLENERKKEQRRTMAWSVTYALSLKDLFYFQTISRLNSVKNTNIGLDNKKIFLMHWKTVFWVTEHFSIKWTFWKNAFFCPKNAFFWQKWQFDHLLSAAQRWCQGTFFPGGNFTPIFEAKK